MPALVNRRSFLGFVASLTAASAIPDGGFGANEVVLPLGFSLYGMKTLPTSQGLRHCAEIGYDAVELALLPDWPCDPRSLSGDDRREIRKLLSDLGLTLSAVMENLPAVVPDDAHRRNLERLKLAAEVAHDLSPDHPPILETVLGGSPAKWNEVKDQMVDRLEAWAEVAAKSRITLAVKPHVGGALHTPEDALWLLDQVNRPEVRLAYDFSHYQLRGYDLAKTIRRLASRSVFVHVKDARGTPEKVEFLLPGSTGTVDYAEYLRLLAMHGYRGPVVVEVSGMIFNKAGYDPLAAARTSYTALASAYDRAGIRRRA